mmetsp:Transcript_42877/g.110594  ORF Transcript_42877/g.110594 Transcript_42877/m.110594 type:complete len:87 (+) Transcript_42877:3287-3547(+)
MDLWRSIQGLEMIHGFLGQRWGNASGRWSHLIFSFLEVLYDFGILGFENFGIFRLSLSLNDKRRMERKSKKNPSNEKEAWQARFLC